MGCFFWGLSPWLTSNSLFPVSSHGLFFVSIFVLFFKDTSQIGFRPTQMTLFCLNYLFNGSLSKYGLHSVVLGVKTSDTWVLRGHSSVYHSYCWHSPLNGRLNSLMLQNIIELWTSFVDEAWLMWPNKWIAPQHPYRISEAVDILH